MEKKLLFITECRFYYQSRRGSRPGLRAAPRAVPKSLNPFTVKKHVMQAFSVVFTEYTRIQIKFQSYKNRIYYSDVYFFLL